MGVSAGRVAFVVACLLWFASCTTAPFAPDGSVKVVEIDKPIDDTTPPAGEITVSSAPQRPSLDYPLATPELLGKDANDDLSIGKKYFRQGSYGLAERHFRKAVELHPNDAESWIGLAAAYDRLRRFDLADRAYANAIRIVGQTPEVLNNQGFSYMLRGDYRRARETLLAARAMDPGNPYVANNMRLLEASERKAKAIN